MLLRVLFSLSLLTWSLTINKPAFMVGLLFSILIGLKWIGQSNILFIRSFKLLLWLYIPILVLHGLMTPGSMIQTPIYIPLSKEGLNQGIFLCLHITLMFFAALLAFRVIKYADLQVLMIFFPKIGNRIRPFLLLFVKLQKVTFTALAKQQEDWKSMKSKWLALPDLIVETIQIVLQLGKTEAKSLWLEWDGRMSSELQAPQSISMLTKLDVAYGGITLLGWMTFFYG